MAGYDNDFHHGGRVGGHEDAYHHLEYDSGETLFDEYGGHTYTNGKVNNLKGNKSKVNFTKTNLNVDAAYEGWVLEKAGALLGERPSWSRVTPRRLPFEDSRLAEVSKRHRALTGKGPLTTFTRLTGVQQSIITRLIAERQSTERNKNAEWVTDCIKKTEEKHWMSGTIEVKKLVVILKRKARDVNRDGQRQTGKAKTNFPDDEIIDLKQPFVESKKNSQKTQLGYDVDSKRDKLPKQPKQGKTKGNGRNVNNDSYAHMQGADPFAGDPFASLGRNDQGDGVGPDNRIVEVPMPQDHYDSYPQAGYAQHQHQQPPLPQGAFPVEQYPQHQPHGHVQQGPPAHNPYPQQQQQQPVYDNNPFTPYPEHNNAGLYAHPAHQHQYPQQPAHHDQYPRARSLPRGDADYHDDDRRRSLSREARKQLKRVEGKVEKISYRLNDKLDAVLDKVEAWNLHGGGESSSQGSSEREHRASWSAGSPSTPGTSPPRSPYGSYRDGGGGLVRSKTRQVRERQHLPERRYTEAAITTVAHGRGRRPSYDHDGHHRRSSGEARQVSRGRNRPRLQHAITHNDYPAGPVAEAVGDGYYDTDYLDRGRRRRQSGVGHWEDELRERERERIYVDERRRPRY